MKNRVNKNSCDVYITIFVLIILYVLAIVMAACLQGLDRNSWVSFVIIIFWIVLYGQSIAMAACFREPHALKIGRRLKDSGLILIIIRWLSSALPYCICIMPHFFPPYHAISDTVLWVLFFLIFTWMMITITRKQLYRNEN
jgi:hypothetical protein